MNYKNERVPVEVIVGLVVCVAVIVVVIGPCSGRSCCRLGVVILSSLSSLFINNAMVGSIKHWHTHSFSYKLIKG